MPGERSPRNYTPYQKKIIQRYYENQPAIAQQQLAELVGDLYLADGRRRQQLWKRAGELMRRLKVSESRIDHLLRLADHRLLAELVQELEGRR